MKKIFFSLFIFANTFAMNENDPQMPPYQHSKVFKCTIGKLSEENEVVKKRIERKSFLKRILEKMKVRR